jgi:hypothetical protein
MLAVVGERVSGRWFRMGASVRGERPEYPPEQHGLLGDVEVGEADTQLMQFKRLADAQPSMRRRKVVEQQQLAWTEQNAVLDRRQVKTPLDEVLSLLGE